MLTNTGTEVSSGKVGDVITISIASKGGFFIEGDYVIAWSPTNDFDPDKIIVLNLGERVAEGTPHEVASNEKVQEVYLGTV